MWARYVPVRTPGETVSAGANTGLASGFPDSLTEIAAPRPGRGQRFWPDAKKQPGIISCSALKRSYRQIIIGDRPEVRLIYLRGGRDLISEHLAGRYGHFMPASLLQSQIDTLEEPDPSEEPLTVDVGPPAGQIAGEIIRLFGATTVVGPTGCAPGSVST